MPSKTVFASFEHNSSSKTVSSCWCFACCTAAALQQNKECFFFARLICVRVMQALAVQSSTPLPSGLADHPSLYSPSRLFAEVAKVTVGASTAPTGPLDRAKTLLRSDSEVAADGIGGLFRDVASMARRAVCEHSVDLNAPRSLQTQRELAECALRAVRIMKS